MKKLVVALFTVMVAVTSCSTGKTGEAPENITQTENEAVTFSTPKDYPLYAVPVTVDIGEIGEMDYTALVNYSTFAPTEPSPPSYWEKYAFIGGDIVTLQEGHDIFETINSFYKVEYEMPDGFYDNSEYTPEHMENPTLKRLFSERSVCELSVDGKRVLCRTPYYSSADAYSNVYELFEGNEIVASAPFGTWRGQELISRGLMNADGTLFIERDYSDVTEIRILDVQTSTVIESLIIQGEVYPKYFDREKLIFSTRSDNGSVLDAYFCIHYGESEAEFLFLAMDGEVSPDGKYLIYSSSTWLYDLPIDHYTYGFYIRNIETGDTAFIPENDRADDLYCVTWVSQSGLSDLLERLR